MSTNKAIAWRNRPQLSWLWFSGFPLGIVSLSSEGGLMGGWKVINSRQRPLPTPLHIMTDVTTPNTKWHSLGGQVVGEPSVTARGDIVNVFYRGEDNKLYVVTHDGSKWSEHVSLEGGIYDNPSAIAINENHVEVLVRGGNGVLYTKAWKNGGWQQSWTNLSGTFTGPPVAVANGDGKTAEVFVINSGGDLYRKSFNGTSWAAQFQRIGRGLVAPPTAALFGENYEVFAVQKSDKALRSKVVRKDGSLSPAGEDLHSQGGKVNRPWVVAAENRLAVFSHDDDGAISHREYDAQAKKWSDWTPQYGKSVDGPTAVSRTANGYHVYYRGTNNQVYRTVFDGTNWNPALTAWNSLGGNITSRPIPVPGHYKKQWIFARGNDKGLHYYI